MSKITEFEKFYEKIKIDHEEKREWDPELERYLKTLI
jgi:hypothetical protein